MTAVYQITVPTATGPVQGFEETPVQSAQSGDATPLLPVDVTGKGNDVSINGAQAFGNGITGVTLSNVVLSFETSYGPTVYICDISDTFNFKKKITLGPINTSTQAGIQEAFGQVNLKADFPNATQLYYRFGSRYASDSPGPIVDPAIYPNPTPYSGGGTYVYSLTNTLRGS